MGNVSVAGEVRLNIHGHKTITPSPRPLPGGSGILGDKRHDGKKQGKTKGIKK